MGSELTRLPRRRQRFIALMLIYGHEKGGSVRAFREAGYEVENDTHASIAAAKLLRDPDVASALAAAQSDAAERLHITQDRVLRELALLAFSDISHYKVDEESGELIVREDEHISPAVTRAVQAVEYITISAGTEDYPVTTRKVKLKLWDKGNALTLLMKYLGMLIERSVNVNANASMTVDQARKIIADAHAPSRADGNDLDLAFQRSVASSVDDIAELPQTSGTEVTLPEEPTDAPGS